MKRIVDRVTSELHWSQPSATKKEFELEGGGDTLATLHFRSSFGSFATARTAEGCWTFKRIGFWQPRITIRTDHSDDEIALFTNNTWSAGGTLDLADGRHFRANTNFWMSSYEFKDETEESLVRFTRIRGTFHYSCTVEVTPKGARLAELPWLVALGWYLSVKMSDESSGLAAGSAAG